jgi:RNA polymerase sigma-70 factor, ECF subfamily
MGGVSAKDVLFPTTHRHARGRSFPPIAQAAVASAGFPVSERDRAAAALLAMRRHAIGTGEAPVACNLWPRFPVEPASTPPLPPTASRNSFAGSTLSLQYPPMARVMTDSRTGDPAFSAFLAASRPRALAFLRRLCGAEAEDVLQETFVKVWRYRAQWDPQRNPQAWLLQAAFRSFLDARRRRQQQPVCAEDIVRSAGSETACPAETREEIARSLSRLQPVERELLLGFHAEGHSLQELAQLHCLPLNTVKSHLHRARRRLVDRDGDVP